MSYKIKVEVTKELKFFANGVETGYVVIPENDKFYVEKNGERSPTSFLNLARAKQVVSVWIRNS
jgi:hypothetical protein